MLASAAGHLRPVPAPPRTPLGRALADRGLLRPPTLQTDETRGASRLELFFDLAFVLVIAELATGLREEVTLGTALRTAALFAVVWWSWMSSTLYANRFDHDDVLFRSIKLTGMLAVVGMAASVAEATGKHATVFVLSYVTIRVLLLLQYARAFRHVEAARDGIRIYLYGTGAGALLWLASLAVDGPARYGLWALGLLVDASAPLLVTASRTKVPLHLEHLPDRFSLFVILVLGESVAGIAHGLYDAEWSPAAVPVALLSFVLAAGLWWSYFDLAGARAKRLLNEVGGDRSSRSHDVYVFGQLPLTLALAAVGAGVELAVVESAAGEVPTGTRLLLAGGVALYLVSAALTDTGMTQGARSGWWWPLAAAVVAAADAVLELPAVVVVGALAALMVAVVIGGWAQRTAGDMAVDEV